MRKCGLFLFLAFCPLLVAQQQTLNNAGVLKLIKGGLSEELIISTINSSPGAYDTSTDGLIALKGMGVDDKIVSSMVSKSVARAPVATSLPQGIDEVGVYFKDKNGTWIALMPEIVNFKTGGVMKSMASYGMVKGDLNGHVAGGHAKTSTAFPVVIAVYVPEGTAITEYQLLRFRGNDKSREFRSVTGGVFHVSGGATRDSLEYQPEKIAPRVYQITLDSSLKRGEYGLLPPNAQGSANLGSSGKVYSISVPE